MQFTYQYAIVNYRKFINRKWVIALFLHSFGTFGYFVYTSYIIVIYLANSLSLYSIAVGNNVPNPWLAFIPFVQFYVIGVITEEYYIYKFRIPKLSVLMSVIMLAQAVAGYLPGFLFFPIPILLNILVALILHKFFYLFEPRRAVLYAFLCILGNVPMTIILFLMRNKQMIMSAGAYRYPFQMR